jgi:hypothetical protein
MSRGGFLAARLATLVAAMLVIACATTAVLNYLKFERLLLVQQARVLEILASDLAEAFEYSMNLGVRLQGVPGAQALLERRRSTEALVDALSVIDASGRILFDTDRQNIGGQAPPGLRPTAGGAWHHSAGERNWVGLPIVNSFGQVEGALMVAYGRDAVDARLDAILLSMARAALIGLAVAIPLGAGAIFLAVGGARRWFAALGEATVPPREAQDPVPAQATEFRAAVAGTSAALAEAEQRLEALATLREPEAVR